MYIGSFLVGVYFLLFNDQKLLILVVTCLFIYVY